MSVSSETDLAIDLDQVMETEEGPTEESPEVCHIGNVIWPTESYIKGCSMFSFCHKSYMIQ